MKKVKKILALAISSLMVTSALTGCASNGDKKTDEGTKPAAEEEKRKCYPKHIPV
ncbi:hypothetical protein M918_08485 [Clostridium sp. BL8]|uniref:hypothetical protein n=1 Tax=Clostridium sp. BL8 TaxID=1354301 RepID=UPI00038A2A02|nr:hypothetical protein [Clostridium sp. BL8]EQB87582.1 hypothetical protein M918_08485 [Clostridium sp. BL8]